MAQAKAKVWGKVKPSELCAGEYRCTSDGDETIVVTSDLHVVPSWVQRAAENAAAYFENGGDYSDDKVITVEVWTGQRFKVEVRSESQRRHYAGRIEELTKG